MNFLFNLIFLEIFLFAWVSHVGARTVESSGGFEGAHSVGRAWHQKTSAHPSVDELWNKAQLC